MGGPAEMSKIHERIVEGGGQQFSIDEEDGELKLRVGEAVLGSYSFLGPAPSDAENLRVPDDGKHGIAFPVLVDGRATVCRFVGRAPRAIAMFAMHKVRHPIAPLTKKLRRMSVAFEEHEEFSIPWMHNVGFLVEDVVGVGGALEIAKMAEEAGLVARDKRGRLVRTRKPIPPGEEWEFLIG
jgi:hypothetical protein